MSIRPYQMGDEVAISRIYNHYILHSSATFEVEPLSAGQMQERIEKYTKSYPWLVYLLDEQIVGYCYASQYHSRDAFRHTVEPSVYVHQDFHGRGIGHALYAELLSQLAHTDCHTIISAIALPNAGSVRLHEAFGFTQVGHLAQVGHKFGQWIDLGYWQKTLN
ncbi:N-acetyltransferase [Lampropedia puyangensis]|uniref:N-acetyltransferase n=1 Tax=Lampropedia puyangensis TaxID=1330072 RepID=A0A4S8FFG8_9BURK|nr:GNAT family N-acetyltransferase [Lampropedia puyangensis]THU04592.1 N-acetyltransferase [Lampropedia puyangensis]